MENIMLMMLLMNFLFFGCCCFSNSHEISYVVFRSQMWYTVRQLQKCHTLQEPLIFSTHLEVMLSLCMSALSLSLSLFWLLICLLVCLSVSTQFESGNRKLENEMHKD
jgi:hypothetical protein